MLIHPKGWNLDTVLNYVNVNGGTIEQDNDSQILIYTDLFEHWDGSLHDAPEAE